MLHRYRIWAAHAVAIPLALLLGCLVSLPNGYSVALLAVILFFFALPLLLQWHHAILIIFWNSAFNAFFLPGEPDFWLVLAAFSFGASTLSYVVFEKKFLSVPELNRPLAALTVVVIFTACYRGGVGIRSLGGTSYGGRYYIYILGAIGGYFALTARRIPIGKSRRLTELFFAAGATNVLPNIVFSLGPAFYFLYYLVPSGVVGGQVANASGLTSMDRISGLSQACIFTVCFLMARYGIRGLMDWSKPWRLFFFCATIAVSCFAGFRSTLMIIFILVASQFYFEGLFRTHFLPIVVGLAVCGFIPILLLADRMPPAVQRTLSFLPVRVDPDVRNDAEGSTEWRLEMWRIVWKDVPKYLIIGKGYSIDPTDMYLTTEAIRMDLLNSYEESILAGDYHSGPLSILIPFGIFGTLAFLWLLGAGLWVLHLNFRFGDARLRQTNSVLLSIYAAYCFSFFFIFGAFNTQLCLFLGIVGFSVSLNDGVKRKLKIVREPLRKQPE